MKQTRTNRNAEHETPERGTNGTSDTNETSSNVLNFSSTLRELRKHINPELVRQREGRRDMGGKVHMVEYIEWHSVADILDEVAPNWTHCVKDIRPIGDIMTVTVAITIDGVTREGIGTGRARSETGIKKAEHDALKRAAVKFGIARDLYKKESEGVESDLASQNPSQEIPVDNVAKNLSDLVTGRQLGMIKALARETGVDLKKECETTMRCSFDELSKRGASQFITHLQGMKRTGDEAAASVPMRKAG